MEKRKKYVRMEADTAMAAVATLLLVRGHMSHVIRKSESDVLGDWFAEDLNAMLVVKDSLMLAVKNAGLGVEDMLRVIAEVRNGGADDE